MSSISQSIRQRLWTLAGDHTAFMYVEDDELVTWEAMLAWAQDEAPLAELGFMRAFARLETRAADGVLMHLSCADPLPTYSNLAPGRSGYCHQSIGY